jgi:hypothetical protein
MGGWVVVGVIILIAVVSAVSQMIKNQQEQAPRRPRPAGGSASAGGTKAGSGDIDRFLQELDKLRKKQADAGGSPARSAPVPVVKPKAKPRPAVVTPKRSKLDLPPPVVAPRRSDDLPVAAVVPPALPSVAPPQPLPPAMTGTATVSRPPRSQPVTPFGRNLAALLSGPQGLQLAIALQEVLGPPKCKRPPG